MKEKLDIKTDKCSECGHFTEKRIDPNELEMLGECRRFPPVTFQIVQQAPKGMVINHNSGYTPVKASNPKCGEFSPNRLN